MSIGIAQRLADTAEEFIRKLNANGLEHLIPREFNKAVSDFQAYTALVQSGGEGEPDTAPKGDVGEKSVADLGDYAVGWNACRQKMLAENARNAKDAKK